MPDSSPAADGIGAVIPYASEQPDWSEVKARPGTLVLDFGTNWCGHCNRAATVVAAVMAEHPDVAHVKVEDGSGRRLGRLFGVKLWPTLVFLRDGHEVARLVRPPDAAAVQGACADLRIASKGPKA